MPSDATTCPYCNAQVVVPERVEAGQRVACPRCGELFAVRTSDNGPPPVQFAPAGLTPSAVEGLAAVGASGRWPNRIIAGVVLGVMAGVAIAALVYALHTVPQRRANDPKTPLGYLPSDTNIVAGVLVTEALKEPTGLEFLTQFRLGPVDLNIGNLERWTGLRRDEIRQIVIGLKIEGSRLPRLTLVVQTHEPYSIKAVREALRAEREVQRGDKTLYRFRLDQGVIQAHLWAPAERILIVGREEEDLDPVPATPRGGIDHLPAAIQAGLSHPMGAGAHAWLLGHHEHWEQTSVQYLITGIGGQDLDTLAKVKTFGFWLRFGKTVRLHSACQCSDESTAQALADYLVRKGVGGEKQIKTQKDAWVTADAETTPKAIRETLAKAFRGPLGIFGK